MKRFSILIISFFFLSACTNKADHQKIQNTNPFFEKAQKFRDVGEVDSSFIYFNRAKDLFLQQKDSLNVGKCLVNMGFIATNKGDFYGGQELSLSAISCLDSTDKNQYAYLISNYNTLGLASYQLKDYANALKFYDAAIKFIDVPSNKLKCLNNKAKVFEELKNYDSAIAIYSKILRELHDDKVEYAKVLTNIAFTRWLKNRNHNPVPELLEALSIREQEGDLLGQNHSYARLADYYIKIKPSLALEYASKMHEVAKQFDSHDDKLEALEKLIKLSPASTSKAYFESYRKLEDSVQMSRNKSKHQFAIIRYETEKHKADNLILQKDNTEKKYQLIKQKSLLIAGLTVAFFVIVLSIILYKKRKQRIELASKNAIRENQLKTSKKVHDRVANKIYSVISEIENKKELDKGHLLDKLDHIYHTSRDISYEITDTQQGKKFSQQLFDMFYTYAADPPHVKITGNEDLIWKNVSSNSKGEIFIVLQELMTNMKKHSQATEVNISFHKNDNSISILYHDNGIGISQDVIQNNGLRNTETRIKNISGTLTFETMDNLGLKILISFPVS